MEVTKRPVSTAALRDSSSRKDGAKPSIFDTDRSTAPGSRSQSANLVKDLRRPGTVAFVRKATTVSSTDDDAQESVVSASSASSQPSSTSKLLRVGSSKKASSSRSADVKQGNNLWMIGPAVVASALSGDVPQTVGTGGLAGERIRKLQRIARARDREALVQLEEMLLACTSGRGSSGPSGEKYRLAAEKLGREYNVIAMKHLQCGANAVALCLLQGAESVISEVGPSHNLDALKGLTYNNLGCYFRREGRLFHSRKPRLP